MSITGLWPIDPHTQAKHALLKLYLDRWFPILGKHNSRINYLDGFAGPGKYSGGEIGSPILAIQSAIEHVAKGTLASSVEVNFIFVERSAGHIAHLRKQVEELSPPIQFNFDFVEGNFRDHLDDILTRIEAEGRKLAPTFAFVDPFGFSGIPMALMARILNFSKCEVFINVMIEEINRFIAHPNAAIAAHFAETFGTDEVLGIPDLSGDRSRFDLLLELYRRQLKQYAKYVGRFDMRGRRDQKKYSLFFATNHPFGFRKMKEAMWKVDRTSGKEFSDADALSGNLFESFGFACLWDEIKVHFARKTVMMSALETHVIERSDYLPEHLRSILKQREESKEIRVHTLPRHKRHGKSFPNDKVQIEFLT